MSTHPYSAGRRETDGFAYRWAYLFLSYGLLAVVIYRSFIQNETSWDLLALVIVAGLGAALFSGKELTHSREWRLAAAGAVLIAVMLAFALTVA